MKLDFFQIHAFTDQLFGGNPACVVLLQDWLPDTLLKKIAKENALPETAFLLMREKELHLRWFTPDIEMDLCGHATLAAAHALRLIDPQRFDSVSFETCSGLLSVTHEGAFYALNLPARKPQPDTLPQTLAEALNLPARETYKARDYVLVYDTEDEIRQIRINRPIFDQINLDPGGVIVTAPGIQSDFVSRFFTPQASILEDPVTGSAHCTLIPFWSERLGKNHLSAIQLSERQGKLHGSLQGDRVVLRGQAQTYASGQIWIPDPHSEHLS